MRTTYGQCFRCGGDIGFAPLIDGKRVVLAHFPVIDGKVRALCLTCGPAHQEEARKAVEASQPKNFGWVSAR
jgi:hypothetical protein